MGSPIIPILADVIINYGDRRGSLCITPEQADGTAEKRGQFIFGIFK